jgi:hypothetical protein
VMDPPAEAFYESIVQPPHIDETYNSEPSEVHADDLRQFNPSCIRDSIQKPATFKAIGLDNILIDLLRVAPTVSADFKHHGSIDKFKIDL